MSRFNSFLIVRYTLQFSLVLIAVLGDFIVSVQKNALLKAIGDNATHALIGVVTWITVLNISKHNISKSNQFFETFLCGVISSFIDLDHFFAARSTNLKEATNLQQRPLLHCSSIPIILHIILLLIAYIENFYFLERISWVCLTAFLSHHIRDASRRGIWLWPFGSTPPLKTTLYLILTVLLPHIINTASEKLTVTRSILTKNAPDVTTV